MLHLENIRTLLQKDPFWTLYALGDLHPPESEFADWRPSANGVALVFRGFSPPVLFVHDEASVESVDEPELYLQVKADVLGKLEPRYVICDLKQMWRMGLGRDPLEMLIETKRLSPARLNEVLALYGDGQEQGEAPEFFDVSKLGDGVFAGVFHDGALVSVAGTHLISSQESAAAIGNVYTRRDFRGRGFGSAVTAAVASELRRRGIATIGLNVRQDNLAAIRAYERIGFVKHCPYVEGRAMRRTAHLSPQKFERPQINTDEHG